MNGILLSITFHIIYIQIVRVCLLWKKFAFHFFCVALEFSNVYPFLRLQRDVDDVHDFKDDIQE